MKKEATDLETWRAQKKATTDDVVVTTIQKPTQTSSKRQVSGTKLFAHNEKNRKNAKQKAS